MKYLSLFVSLLFFQNSDSWNKCNKNKTQTIRIKSTISPFLLLFTVCVVLHNAALQKTRNRSNFLIVQQPNAAIVQVVSPWAHLLHVGGIGTLTYETLFYITRSHNDHRHRYQSHIIFILINPLLNCIQVKRKKMMK